MLPLQTNNTNKLSMSGLLVVVIVVFKMICTLSFNCSYSFIENKVL